MAEARAELVTAKRLRGEDFERGVTLLGERIVAPEIRDRFETIVRAGLQKAGMLEEQP